MKLPTFAAIAAAVAALRARLIPDLQAAWRLWSVRIAALGALATALLAASPDALLAAWQALPPDVRELVPVELDRWIAPALFALATVARITRQKGQGDEA
jgi:hypothetical protein